MSAFRLFFRRTGRPGPLRVNNGDTFAACGEKYGITAREGEIIRLLLGGKGNKEITEALFISDHTVKNHIHHIYQKFGIKNRVQLVQCYRAALEESGGIPAGARAAEGALPDAREKSGGFRRAALPAALLFIVFALVLVAWNPWGRKPRTIVLPPTPVLAVLDFENLSGDPELEKWVTGLPLLLTTDLLQSKLLRTRSDDAVFGALKKFNLTDRKRYSREDLRLLAKEMRADYLLTGSLMKAGGRIVVTAFLQDARTGAPIRTEKIESPDEQGLMRGVDGLAQLIKSALNLASARAQTDVDLDIEVLTTSSALAFKYYAEGRRYHHTGDYEQALLMLRKAVELDPEFAMAYRGMSVAARNLGYYKQEAVFKQKAFDLSARLPENCRERNLIRGDYYSLSEATHARAVEAYKRVLADHPDDLIANNNLAMLCYELEDFEAAGKYADVPIRQGIDNPFPFYTKAISLASMGRSDEAIRLLVAYHENHPANRLIYQVLADTLIETNDFVGAGAALDKAAAVFPDPSWAYWKGTVLFHTQGAGAAREEYRRLFLMDAGPWQIRAHVRLGNVALAEGRFREAEDQFRGGAELAETIGESNGASDLRQLLGQVFLDTGRPAAALLEARRAVESGQASGNGSRLRAAMHFQGLACLRNKEPSTVDSLTARFKSMAAAGSTKRPARDYDFFQGMIALEKGLPFEAAKLIEKAVSQLPPGNSSDSRKMLFYVTLASAREKAGDFAGAASAYQEVTGSAGDRLQIAEYYPWSVLGLARMEERLGRPARALEGYRSFLALWKDADPGRPEIAEAQGRFDALSGATGRNK
jgi:tetratricopeptide (TPR) repeat protein/DNA-binding CsgD family transcriptional regulator/TolB-like protein